MENTINDIEVFLANPLEIPMAWERLRPFLQKCADSSVEVEDAADYYHRLTTGFSGLFIARKNEAILGVFIIQRMEFPHMNICHVSALAGDRITEWLEAANDAIYNWAATNDCQLIKAEGRPGWKKFYKEQGWQMDKVIFTLPVNQNLH